MLRESRRIANFLPMKQKNLRIAIFFSLATLALPATVWGQDPVPEPELPPSPPSWSLGMDLSFSGASGNDRTLLLISGLKLTHLRTDRFEFEWSGDVRYGRSEGREVARRLRTGVKLDISPQARWSPFIFSTAERDPFRKLDVRASGGAGVKHILWQSDAGSASLSAAGLFSYEAVEPEDGVPAGPSEQVARWSWRLKADRKLAEHVRLEHTSFYQPIWDRLGDYLIEARSGLTVRVSERVGLSLGHQFDRDSTPAQGVLKDDHVVTAGLSLQTRW